MEKLHFLIVEDSSTISEIIKNSLKAIGFNDSTQVGDGREALEKLENDESINFIITGWNMRGMDGFVMVKTIRNNEKLKKLPILMVGVRGMKEDTGDAMDVGVNDYIVRLFSFEHLQEKIEKVLSENSFKKTSEEITKATIKVAEEGYNDGGNY